jgi:hypothetical protein
MQKLVYGAWSSIIAATQDGTLQSSSSNYFKALYAALDDMYDTVESSSGLKSMPTSTTFGSLLDAAFAPAKFNTNYDGDYFSFVFSTANRSLGNDMYQCYLRDQITNYACPSFNDLSAQWVYYNDDFPGGSGDINLKNGYITLINYLSSSLNAAKQIRLNEIVTNIEYALAAKSAGNITVTSLNNLTGKVTIYKCKQLVSSVSLNVLKNTKNLFTPPLPASKLTSLNNLRLGTNNKVFFVFSQNVFTNGMRGLSFIWNNNTPISLNADKICNVKLKVSFLT